MSANLEHRTYHELEDVEDAEVEIDWQYQNFRRQYGEITVIHTWNFGNKDAPEPCLVLAPSYMPPNPEDIHVCVVELKDAWRWSRDHNDDEQVVDIPGTDIRISGDQWQREMGQYFAMCLGLSRHDPATIRRIRGIIEDHLIYLVNLPPAPERENAHVIHAEVTDMSTGKTTESTVKTV